MNLLEKQQNEFAKRHIGPNEKETTAMLAEIGFTTIEELIDKTIPENIRLQNELELPAAISEF